jgi:hypothetical protein
MESAGRECDREEWPAGDTGSDTDSAMVGGERGSNFRRV